MPKSSTSDEAQQDPANSTTELSEREIEILALIAEGWTDNEIATELWLSAKTVSQYVKRIRAKLGARTRAQAVATAMRQGILSGKLSPEKDS